MKIKHARCIDCEGWGIGRIEPKSICGWCDGTGTICTRCSQPLGRCDCPEEDME